MLKRGNFRLFSVLSTIGVVAALLVGIAGGAAGAGVDPDRTGLQDPATATWTVHNKTPFVFGNPGDAAFMGDWDCDGVDTPGLYRAVSTSSGPAGKVYLRNSATSGIADLEFFYGNPNDVPIAGDFNDDGCDTVSLYRPSTQTVHIANRLGSAGQGIGSADITYTFSPAGTPIAGDWDGDGTDTVGMWLDSTGQFVLRNSHSSDAANDVAFYFGQSGDRPVAGDFLGQASSTVGVYRHAAAKFFLRDPGNPAQEVTFPGAPNSQPLSWAPSPNPGGVAGIPASTLPRGKKNAARVLLENLVDSGTLSTQNRKTVNKAIVRILDSLDPTLWFNDAYLDDAGGNHVFDRERQAAVELEKVFGVDPTIDNALNLLVMADRTLAANAIAVAVASGGDQTDINQANARLADGDAHDAADEHPEAIGDYKKAWQAAQKAAQGINRFPIAADDAGAGFVTDEDTAFVTASVFGNDFDLDNDPLSIVSVDTTGTQGTVSHAGGGTFNYDPGAAFQSLSTSQFATDTFSYVVGDGNGGTDTAVVVITVTGINDPPTAVDDPFATTEDEVARGAVLANDSDPEGHVPLVVTAVNGTALPFDVDGLPVPVALAPSGASLTMDSTGVFTYNPTLAYNSLNAGEQAADSFTYTVADTTGLTSVATVTVGITGVDDPPFAGPDSFTTTEDLAFTTTDVTLNDGDPDSADTISLTGPVHGLAGFPSGAGAKLVNNNDGTFDYDPGSVFQYLAAGETASDAFEYEITSSNAGTASGAVSVTVTGVNDAPTAQAQVLSTSGSPITILLKGADVDTSDDLDFSVDAAGTLGTLGTPDNNDGTCTPVGACVAPDKNTATVSYTPPAPANPGDPDPTTSFTFTVTDDAGATATATVTLNPPPEGTTPPADPLGIDAKDRIVEVTAGTTTSILMVASAPIAPQQGAIGNLTFTVNGSGTSGTLGTPIDIVPLSGPVRSARVGYNPGTFTGTTSFTFTACEAVSPPAQPTNCDTGTVTLQVGLTAATRPPQATDQAVVTPINTPVDINLATISTGGGTPPICDPGSGCGRAAPSAAPSIQADTFDDQSEFLAQLDTSTTFNFEQPTFPASPNVIGSVGGVNFTGRIGFFATAAPEGQQFMRGTNVGPPFTGPSVVDFSGLGELPNAIGFFAEEGANAPATSLEVTISFNDDTSVTQTVGGLSGTPAYFGFVEKGKRIESVTFQGKAGAADSEFLVDLLTYGVAGTVSVFADVAGEVSDIDSDGLGDGENELLPGGTAPLVISAGVDVNPHCGTTGRPACGLNPNEASFESGLTVSTQYDFETGSGFPAAGGTIGLFGGINFAAQTANFTSPPSGTQAMTGAGGTFTTATLDFTGLERRPIAIGFIALDLTQVGQEVIEVKITLSDNTVQTHDVQLAPSDPAFTPKHFGFVAPQFRTIKQVELRGTEAASRTTNRAWLIDDFVAGFDTGNAAVSTTSGIVRTQIEFDIDSLGLTPGEVESATVTLTTDKGSIDSLDTLFYVAAVDGDGDLSPSDFQTPAIQLDGVVMEVTPGVSTFSIDVADELRTALEAGFDYLVIQARVNEQLATGGSIQRGLQFRSTAAANLGNGTAPKLEVGVGDGPVAAIQQFAITSLPANGTLLIGGTPVTALPAVAPLAQVTFQPATGFTGVTSFNFQVTNVSSGLFDSGKVWVNVGSVLGTGLTVNIDFLGAGTGSVLTTGGTLCATDCTVQFLGGAAIMLEARPDSSGGFGGYGGDCSGTGQLFTLPAASGVKNCTVTFNP